MTSSYYPAALVAAVAAAIALFPAINLRLTTAGNRMPRTAINTVICHQVSIRIALAIFVTALAIIIQDIPKPVAAIVDALAILANYTPDMVAIKRRRRLPKAAQSDTSAGPELPKRLIY